MGYSIMVSIIMFFKVCYLAFKLFFSQQNERLCMQMLDIEYNAHPVDEDNVMSAFNRILSSDISLEFKVKISQRRMEFLEDFGTYINR